MGDRGRQSAAALTVITPVGTRPKPPTSLSPAQAARWNTIVASEPASFFKTAAAQALLADYCRHATTAAILAKEIDGFDPAWIRLDEGLSRYSQLLILREREVRAAASLLVKLRLTNQSRYTPQAAGTAGRKTTSFKKPWDYDG